MGNVLKNKVATKYYIENNKDKIITNDDGNFSSLNKNNQKVVITQIGYSFKEAIGDNKGKIEIVTMPENTKEVPKHLPLKIDSLKSAFVNLKLGKVLNLDKWNVSNVTNMISLFFGAENFDQPLNLWDVSKVITMSNMFNGASKFNQDLNNWNVSNVVDMEEMFHSAVSFNGKIGDWNVENVEKLDDMFLYANKFQQDLSKWKTKKVKSTRWQFIFDNTYQYKNKILEAWMKNN